MRHLIFTALLAFAVLLTAQAEPVSREQARLKAEQFLKDKAGQKRLTAVTNHKRLAPRPAGATATAAEPYYVFDRGDDGGFIVVSGDDRTVDVLGYCDNGSFDYEQLPPALQEWIDDYAAQLTRIQSGAAVITDVIPTHPRVEPMMKSKWSQGDPYNRLCPLDGGSRSVTGCVATAMAQLLYYNREKSVTETQATIPAFTTWTKGIHVDAIPAGSPIDWDHMADTYGSATELQKTAVAQLMLYCGAAVKMDYTNGSSGAQSHDAYLAFINYFGYGSSVKWYDYTNVSSDTEWDRIVYAEMAAGRPVYVSGSNSSAGHAFVAHGYDGNLRYYINWGWGGQSDGWYYLTNLTPGDGQGIGGSASGYNEYRQIFVGIEPENYGAKAMSFSDATVRQLCVANWDADADGKLTYSEAAAVTSLGTVFKGKNIKTFNELYYFTGLTQIDDDAFNGCTQLTALRLPKSLQRVGQRAFMNCQKLQQVDFFASMKEIGAEAFSGCTALTGMELPGELTAVNEGTFRNCTSLTEMTLPICVETLGNGAFSGCKSLTDFTVKTYHPENITMGTDVFSGTSTDKATLHVLQGMKGYFRSADQWQSFGTIAENRERSGGLFADIETGQTYYLYNVGTGRYLTKGEAWGTQAVVGDEPMRFKLNHSASMPDGVYYLTSTDTGKSGTYLFRTSTDDNVGTGVQAAFVDGTSLTANAYWHITAVKDKVYTLQIPAGGTNYNAAHRWGVQPDHASEAASPTYGVYSDIDYSAHPYNCQWQFAVYTDEKAAVYEAAEALGNLLTMAKKRGIRHDGEQAVYDRLESSLDDLQAAQVSLRRKMNLINFADRQIRTACVSLFDSNGDGEVSISEAADISELPSGFTFSSNTSLKSFDELQYFTSIPDIYGAMFSGCTNMESVTLPEGLIHIYYRAFLNCRKLTKINIPAYVTTIGDNCFTGCTALREVTVGSPDPSTINLGNNIFSNVDLSQCTLRVPLGSKALYEAASVWQQFGQIVEVRSTTQPQFSPITENVSGYIYNIGTRRLLTLGEAYGTQSVVGTKGRLFQWRRTGNMADGVYYLYDVKNGKAVFRTTSDSRVGQGVKACFGDGAVSQSAYWQTATAGDNIYMLQVPQGDANYTANQYLGINESHASDAASPTSGIYWDIDGINKYTQWAFITEEDMNTAKAIDKAAAELASLIETAHDTDTDATDEEAVYNDGNSTAEALQAAIVSLRRKLRFIDFADSKTKALCVDYWDADGDGELHQDEAAQVTSLGKAFSKNTSVVSFEELRYFTSLTAIADSAFMECTNLKVVTIPANVQQLGTYAFLRCNNLKYVIIDNDRQVVPRGESTLPATATLFVPAARVDDYQADQVWSTFYHISAYTGQPVVSATATREYGRSSAAIEVLVDGAPVNGEPTATCAEANNRYAAVGTYPIVVEAGTVTTPNVLLTNGTLTITPAPLTITAQSYTREVGQPNPTFELTYSTFRNRETPDVLTQQPTVTCLADEQSPAGIYDIVVSGAEAQNYAITYVNGTLTVTDAQGISTVTEGTERTAAIYDLQGRRVTSPRQGLYIKGHRKVVSGLPK